MIHVGTCGYSYDDWLGKFYPAELRKSEMLSFYARRFRALEVNFSFYRMPEAATLEQMARKTPEGFRFAVKAYRELTHEISDDEGHFLAFREALEPLQKTGKFACVLAQFPYSFKPSEESAHHLTRLRSHFADLPVVVEFRNGRWAHAEAFELLRELQLGYCCVDEPRLKGLMPPVTVATSPIGYVRFHGRNAAQWFEHEQAWQRYDYLYSEAELAEWVGKAKALADETEETYVFFNNHYDAKATVNALMFLRMLGILPSGDKPEGAPDQLQFPLR